MKRFIIFIIIINFAVASSSSVKNEEFLISVKKDFISNINFFIPEYLRIDSEKTFFDTFLRYDTINSKLQSGVSVNIKLPSIIIRKPSSSDKFSLTYKIRPLLRLKKNGLKLFLSSILNYKKKYFKLSQKTYLYTDGSWEGDFQISDTFFKHTYTFTISTDKTSFPNYTYTFGIYKPLKASKKIFVTGYEFSGDKSENPFIYSHTLFVSYREKIFNSKRFFFEIKPYLLFSKEYRFKPKCAVNMNINYKF